MTDGFQTVVTNQPAPAVAGDFASLNPMWTYDAGPGGLVCGPGGLAAGLFAWTSAPADGDGTPSVANNFGTGPVAGFVARDQQGLITTYLAGSSMLTPQGFQTTLFIGGDFWCKNDGATQALPGMKAYATFANGQVTFAATGAATTGASSTGSTIAAATFSATGSILNDIMTVTAVGSGTIYPGSTISGTSVASGSKVVRQLTGTAGGIGTYAVSIPEQVVASTTISGTYGLFTAGTTTGTYHVGDVLTGSTTVAGTTLTAFITGTGGAGTYAVDGTQTVGSATLSTLAINVETKWYCRSSGQPGELVKISSQPLG